ncbi:MAG TPA: hypothetical protein VFM46_02265, partial [Pseudomonadales bacterium]|nr:hypothetical protein [Pseudomonadales bacterium]
KTAKTKTAKTVVAKKPSAAVVSNKKQTAKPAAKAQAKATSKKVEKNVPVAKSVRQPVEKAVKKTPNTLKTKQESAKSKVELKPMASPNAPVTPTKAKRKQPSSQKSAMPAQPEANNQSLMDTVNVQANSTVERSKKATTMDDWEEMLSKEVQRFMQRKGIVRG